MKQGQRLIEFCQENTLVRAKSSCNNTREDSTHRHHWISSVQFSRLVMSNFLRPHEPQHARPLSITNCWSLPKPMSIESVMPSNHHILSCPLLLPSIFPSNRSFPISLFFTSGGPKYWSFSFSISPSNEYWGLISFRIDWLDLLAVQGTLKSSPTPQFKSINSLALGFLYGSTSTFIHDYWKKQSFDKMDLCWQSNVSAF